MRVGDERSLACFTLRDSLNGVTYIMHKLETKRNQKKKRNRCRLQWDLLWFGQTKPSGARNTNSTYEANMFVCMEYGFMAKWCFRVHLIFFSFCSLSLSGFSLSVKALYQSNGCMCACMCTAACQPTYGYRMFNSIRFILVALLPPIVCHTII